MASKKVTKKLEYKQSETNVGLCGHVDHGKTTLVKALSGVWTQKFSNENERGITIKLGYAESEIYSCPECGRSYTMSIAKDLRAYNISKGLIPKNTPKMGCPFDKTKLEFKRRISFVDAPGHEILMATMLSGASLMDGAIVLVSADEPVGMPQTKEHLAALDIAAINKVIVVQNKVDAVGKEKAKQHYKELKKFLKNYKCAKNAPIIPVSAIFNANVDILVSKIEEIIPTPEFDESKDLLFNVARSFDVNKPGTGIDDLYGGVIGGSIISGKIKVGDEIEIRPGMKHDNKWIPVKTTVASIFAGSQPLKEAQPGGLIALGTGVDPSTTQADQLIGNVIGIPGKMPETLSKIEIETHLLANVLGTEEDDLKVMPFKLKELLMIVVGTTLSAGIITNIGKKDTIKVKLTRPICATEGSIIAISRKVKGRFRLIGHGYLK